MGDRRYAESKPWMLFAFPLAIAVPIIAGVLLGGPMLGFPVAALVAIVIVGVAIRKQPAEQRAVAPKESAWQPAAAARRFVAPATIVVAGAILVIVTAGTARIVGWTAPVQRSGVAPGALNRRERGRRANGSGRQCLPAGRSRTSSTSSSTSASAQMSTLSGG